MANYQKNIQSQANPTNWITSTPSKHFTYKVETNRPWKAETVLELLEQAHQAFEKLMGPGLDTVIEVEDRVCEQIIDTATPPHTTIARYKLLFDQMHADDPENLLTFCRDLATCFRQQRSREETDISPVLQRYLGTALEED